MRKVLASLLAAGLLVAGGVAFALVQDAPAATAQETTTEDDTATTDDSADTSLERPRRGAIVAEVWEELIADGVVTAEQAETIQAAFQEKMAEIRAEFGDRGPRHRFHFQLGQLLEDGVIDADELAELGEDHPLNDPDGPFADAAADGEITQEELEELRGSLGFRGPRNVEDSDGA